MHLIGHQVESSHCLWWLKSLILLCNEHGSELCGEHFKSESDLTFTLRKCFLCTYQCWHPPEQKRKARFSCCCFLFWHLPFEWKQNVQQNPRARISCFSRLLNVDWVFRKVEKVKVKGRMEKGEEEEEQETALAFFSVVESPWPAELGSRAWWHVVPGELSLTWNLEP